MNTRARILLFIMFGFGFLFIGYSITSRGNDLPQGQLDIESAPLSADVSVDGRSAKSGEQTLDIGPHQVKFSMPGFTSQEKTVNITQATKTYLGVVLSPSEDSTQDWFSNHEADQKQVEAISDHQSDNQNALIASKYPIFVRLPVVFGNGSDGLTKINPENGVNNSNKPSIGIYATSPEQRQEALDWIYNRDYTLSDIDVVFYGARIPLATGVPE